MPGRKSYIVAVDLVRIVSKGCPRLVQLDFHTLDMMLMTGDEIGLKVKMMHLLYQKEMVATSGEIKAA